MYKHDVYIQTIRWRDILVTFCGHFYKGSPLDHLQAAEYFEQLKHAEGGWQLCAAALTSGTYVK